MRKFSAYIAALLVTSCLFAQDELSFIDAVQAYSDRNFEKALEMFSALHAKDSLDDASAYYAGICLYALGRNSESEEYLRKSIRLDSTNTWYLNSLASLYTSTERRTEAAEICEKLIRMKPATYKTPYVLTIIADNKLSLRQDSLALSYYNNALEIDPTYAPAELGKAETMRMSGNFPAFFASLGNIVENPTVVPNMKGNYLKLILENMNPKFWWVWGDQLTRLVDRAVELHPSDVESRLSKISICSIRRDTVALLDHCGVLVSISREQKDTANLLMSLSTIADINHQQGKKKEAYRMYDNILKIKPDYAPVLNNYAYFLSEDRKKLGKALRMSASAIAMEPDNATYLDTYGWILYLLKRPGEAKPHFKHAMIYGGKDSPVVLEHYAKVLEALGEDKLAQYYHSLSSQKKR